MFSNRETIDFGVAKKMTNAVPKTGIAVQTLGVGVLASNANTDHAIIPMPIAASKPNIGDSCPGRRWSSSAQHAPTNNSQPRVGRR